MRLSTLQKFILLKCYHSRSLKVDRNSFVTFYGKKGTARADMRTKVITGSLENLIDKELLTGIGERTKHKWFIRQVSLTANGKKQARKLLGQQLKFKLK